MNITLCEIVTPADAAVDSYSPFCLKVRRALYTLGYDFELWQAANPATFKLINESKQVPIMIVDGNVISDSTAILRKLSDMSNRFVPSDRKLGGQAWLWEDYADRALNGYLVAARWASDDNWPTTCSAYFGGAPWFVRKLIAPQLRKKVVSNLVARDVIRSGLSQTWSDFQRVLDFLDAAAPTQAFWVGDELTVADFSLFGQLQGMRTPLTIKQQAMVEQRTQLTAYLDRVDAATKKQPSQKMTSRDKKA
jgi:glutathione S-transferase